jgi:2'-5' RNA ligase
MSDLRYGFYLRPSYEMSRAQIEIHHILERQYGLRAAGKFMPHGTIKGFFRSDAPVEELVTRLDAVMDGRRSFPIYNRGVVRFGTAGIALNIAQTPAGVRNERLQALHDAALEALMPLVDPGCDFTQGEWKGPAFTAHLTLAMADIPAPFFDEIVDFVRAAEPIGPDQFPLEVVTLWAFRSACWGGRWWETLTWQPLRSWRLEDEPAPA